MEQFVKSGDLLERWNERITFKVWESCKNTNKAISSKKLDRSELIASIANTENILQEHILVLKYATQLISIIYYNEEGLLELIIGKALTCSQRISFRVSSPELLNLLKEL